MCIDSIAVDALRSVCTCPPPGHVAARVSYEILLDRPWLSTLLYSVLADRIMTTSSIVLHTRFLIIDMSSCQVSRDRRQIRYGPTGEHFCSQRTGLRRIPDQLFHGHCGQSILRRDRWVILSTFWLFDCTITSVALKS